MILRKLYVEHWPDIRPQVWGGKGARKEQKPLSAAWPRHTEGFVAEEMPWTSNVQIGESWTKWFGGLSWPYVTTTRTNEVRFISQRTLPILDGNRFTFSLSVRLHELSNLFASVPKTVKSTAQVRQRMAMRAVTPIRTSRCSVRDSTDGSHISPLKDISTRQNSWHPTRSTVIKCDRIKVIKLPPTHVISKEKIGDP